MEAQMRKNPAAYNVPANLPTEEAFDAAIERHPVRSTLTQLAHHGLVGPDYHDFRLLCDNAFLRSKQTCARSWVPWVTYNVCRLTWSRAAR